jgi:catechol 2,3-dioxygenase-like lactoylglutathione lyase family enzyme
MKAGSSPRIFRILLPATDLQRSTKFYESLLGAPGRPVGGGRVYFDCGPVLLGILDLSTEPDAERQTIPESVYFATGDLGGVYRRARRLRCLAPGEVHGDAAGAMAVRPWGERSFYAVDPDGNSLCFVDDKTLYTGTPRQVAALTRRPRPTATPPSTAGVGGSPPRARARRPT